MTETLFSEIPVSSLKENPFTLIGEEWMLITAGDIKSFNMMTASWGGLGVLWNKNVCFCVIRPGRHTYGFMEKADHFSLSFFSEKYRDMLRFCGSKSGKTINKAEATGITPAASPSGAVYFNEARLVLECKKIYFQDLQPQHFLAPDIEKNYPAKDYHRMYIGEIVRCLVKK
ncbi:MAG: flavin reductase [Elusimicrobia bacterium RIFOXYB2_FULL_49_7]|nr:MAG: flavin reductase [Elusimicrobia bacterium RIFOXYB2_FULL_49_7]